MSMWFLCSRGSVNERLGGAEELGAGNWLQRTSTPVERVSVQSGVCECMHVMPNTGRPDNGLTTTDLLLRETKMAVRCDGGLFYAVNCVIAEDTRYDIWNYSRHQGEHVRNVLPLATLFETFYDMSRDTDR